MDGALALEDGRVFEGESFGAEGIAEGEIVFNTSMTGYQEIMTDPSYLGQIVTMTYPLMGNYGTNSGDVESRAPQVSGFVVREYCPYPSNAAAEHSLTDYLLEYGVVALAEVDTRALTKHIREAGAMKAVLAAGDHDRDELVDRARASRGLVGVDLVKKATCKETYTFHEGGDLHVVVHDYGTKLNILRCLVAEGFRVTVAPATATAEHILALEPDGVLLSNGPGDPEPVDYAVGTVRELVGQVPMFGICMGQHILGRALGGKTFKLKFGHRGANHPVKNLDSGSIDITCQNHGFCVDMDSLDESEVELTHVNLNDGTLEGLRHKGLPVMSVQYHPEASAGPHDARHLFREFKELVRRGKE